jgi:quercetin 2,3-dioxygenase
MHTSSMARPGVSIRRSADRHQTRIGWLHGRHSFDTGIDPLGADTHHGVLVVSNHDTIAPRSGFETHPHRNMEIVTWVLNGSLVHQDSAGHTGVIYPNLAQRMTATGIRHSEKNDRSAVNPGADRPLDLIQMWVVPDEPEVVPGYEQLELDPSDLQGRLAVVASGMARDRDQAAIRIRNRYAALHVARLHPGDSVTVPDAPFAHVYLARGRMDLEAEGVLDAGDAARLTAAGERRLVAAEPSEVLIWEMHAVFGGQDASYTGHVALRALVPFGRVPEAIIADPYALYVGAGRSLIHYPLRRRTTMNLLGNARLSPQSTDGDLKLEVIILMHELNHALNC